jgi:AsmA protein
LHATDVTFANPGWAREKQMITAPAVDMSLDLPLFLGGTTFAAGGEARSPVVFFERGTDGRKNWLLDQEQRDESERVSIGRLTVDHGRLGYDDPSQKTAIVVEISSRDPASAATEARAADQGIVFKASGKYRGQQLTASGSGGPVLALRDESTPYPLAIVATIGPTSIKADGTVTSLVKHSAVDLNLALRGSSLADLYDLFEIALPETRAYDIAGHLTHDANLWRYEKLSGRIGQSDVSGSMNITNAGERPLVKGDLAFKSLYLGDLGPVVGEEPGSSPRQTDRQGRKLAQRKARPASRRLPAIPFSRDRWTTVDADVQVKAQTILRPKALPLENMTTRMRMRDSVLTLEPLDFGAAGGHLDGVIRLDGQQNPIRAHARLNVHKMLLGKLLPTVELAKNSVGQVNGQIELAGRGDSVANMLATADGKVGLVVEGGKISKLLMERIAAHIPETMLQQMTGDELIDIRCGVADFNVEHGTMSVGTLVLDTDVTKVVGRGSVDLSKETMDLTLVPKAKRLSLLAMRGPIYVRGDLAHPDVAVDTARVGMRTLAALALGAINPRPLGGRAHRPGFGKGQRLRRAYQPGARACSASSAQPASSRANAKAASPASPRK